MIVIPRSLPVTTLAYKRDLQNLEFHLFDTGHFALEEDGEAIASYIAQFLASRLQPIPA